MPRNAKSTCRVIPWVRRGRDDGSREAMETCPLGHSAAQHGLGVTWHY